MRVFNARKSDLADRHIGDRRSCNLLERSVQGPSAWLPTGALLTSIVVKPKSILVGCCTDRRDYYHQLRISHEKAACNAAGSRIPVDLALSLAPDKVPSGEAGKKREERGDGLGVQVGERRRPEKGARLVQPCFNSCFQGDRLGVEVATSAHEGVLQEARLLQPESRLLTRSPCPGNLVFEGVVIDDCFVLSAEPASLLRPLQLSSEGCPQRPLLKCRLRLGFTRSTRLQDFPRRTL